MLAAAQGRNQYLEEGKRLLAKGRAEQALDELTRAIEMPELPDDHRVQILLYLGAALFLLDRKDEAEAPWAERLRLSPDAPVDGSLPDGVREAYEAVRGRTVLLDHLPPAGAFAGRPLVLRAAVIDEQARATDVIAYYRRSGEPFYQAIEFTSSEGVWTAELSMPLLAGSATSYDLQYYLVAQADTGEVLHTLGSAGVPLSIKVVASAVPTSDLELIRAVSIDPDFEDPMDAPKRPSTARGGGKWVWVALGVVALGAVVGGVVVGAGGGDKVPDTTLGVIEYP